MFKKCFFGFMNKFWFQKTKTYINCNKFSFVTYKNYKNIIRSTIPINIFKHMQKNKMCKKPNNILLELLMVSYYYQANNKEDVNDILLELFELIQAELKENNYEAAENILKFSMGIAEEHKHYKIWSDLSYTLVLVALSQNQVQKAQKIIVNTLDQLYIWGFPEDDHQVIDLQFCLSSVCSYEGNDEMADMGFKICLLQQEPKILGSNVKDEEILLYVDILFYYGLHMMKRHMYKEAKDKVDAACEFINRLDIIPLRKVVLMLCKRAELNAKLGDYKTALNDMIDVTILAKDIGSRDIPFCYMKLGEICIHLKLYKEAKESYEEALKYATMFSKSDYIPEIKENISELEKIT